MKVILCVTFCLVALSFSGCGVKSPTALKGSGKININNSILNERYSFVPKDDFLRNMDWAYQIEIIPEGRYLISNEQMVKTFLLAHNASKIVIIGGGKIIEEYKEYLEDNGVTAEINLQPVETSDKEFVNLLFFNTKDKK